MEYSAFDQIDLPNLTVTEANPAHQLSFRRFSSDQVVAFNRLQVDILRKFTRAPIAHNYMGRITDFDHYKVGDDLDIASWDSYPLGFLEDRVGADVMHQKRYARQGDPDFQAFHHDLYRTVGKGRWWVMEQQPGPVNWAPFNPDPLRGWCDFGLGKPLPMGRRPCAISAGGRRPWLGNRYRRAFAPAAKRRPHFVRHAKRPEKSPSLRGIAGSVRYRIVF